MPESLPEGHFRTGQGGADRPARLGWSARLWRLRHGPAAASRDQTLRTSSQQGQAVDNHLRYQADSRCRASRDGSRHCDLDVRLETVTRDVTSCGTRGPGWVTVQSPWPLGDAATAGKCSAGLPADAVTPLALEAVFQSGAGPASSGCAPLPRARRSDSSDPNRTHGQPLGKLRRSGRREPGMQAPVEIAVDEVEQVVARVAGIDVAKASGMVCTRLPHESVPGRRVTRVWPVKSTTAALGELADQLREQGIERIVIESTSDYWRPFFYLLEAAGLSVWLVNAAQVKHVPGRPKTDKLDAVWLGQLGGERVGSPPLVAAG